MARRRRRSKYVRETERYDNDPIIPAGLLREQREAMGMTLQQLSEATGGISISRLSRMELGNTMLDNESLRVLASVLGLKFIPSKPAEIRMWER